ncbi:MAG: CocE/NonD family hydrolase [Synechocystis sp.]
MVTIQQQTRSMITRDGVRLDSDLYYPPGAQPLPALLMRQPYGRAIASTLVYAHPRWYAAQGYLVDIQDVRGRGTSAGEFDLFAQEINDGLDCLHWVAQLPECDGTVGMYGFSYQGMTQLYAAANHSLILKTICPAMIAWDLYQDWAYENGAFCLQNNLGWALQLAADSAKLKGDLLCFSNLYQLTKTYNFNDPSPANPQGFQELAPDSFYHDWLSREQTDSYWQRRSPNQLWQTLDIPVLQIGGWFDPHLRGNLRLFRALKQADVRQKLVIGPWGHFPWGRRSGSQDYGETAVSGIDELQIAWFDHVLKQQSPRFSPALLEVFDLGDRQWRELDNFPEKMQSWYLQCSGLASVQTGKLSLEKINSSAIKFDSWVHDPWRPVPSLGGHASNPQGVFERGKIDDRADVVTYTSGPLLESLTVCGVPELVIKMQTDRPSFDLAVTVSQITLNAQVLPFSHGYCHSPQAEADLEIPLQATCITLAKGDRLRVSLSGASFPAYPVNPSTGQKPTHAYLGDQQVITLTIKNSPDFIACLNLPILSQLQTG